MDHGFGLCLKTLWRLWVILSCISSIGFAVPMHINGHLSAWAHAGEGVTISVLFDLSSVFVRVHALLCVCPVSCLYYYYRPSPGIGNWANQLCSFPSGSDKASFPAVHQNFRAGLSIFNEVQSLNQSSSKSVSQFPCMHFAMSYQSYTRVLCLFNNANIGILFVSNSC